MSLRTFTVFQDTPSIDASKPKVAPAARITRSSTLGAENSTSITTLATLAVIVDKENLHPVTGERAGPSSSDVGKKRKTNVLATKVHVPLGVKKLKESKDAQPETKKRKALAPSSSAVKGKAVTKKDVKGSGSARKTTKRSTRRVSPMPKVDEEAEGEKERDRIVQADIDSKCYELTVQPLADVSQAYEQLSPLEDPLEQEQVRFPAIKESSTEPEIRDYFSPPLGASVSRLRTSSEEPKEARAFSTPERKQIYAAFTFSSPSPSSDRFSKARRSRSGSPTPNRA
ncbi:hypothetical protein BDQ12DRAFT_684505 [Crucibulum laeve]|uniref:Uncharacterized protein n=1 Tax=Crucibulum laeve TaxID=68775 RepID=A0A5C3LZL0_9AGAR|nr:hypothetical protein BDQ12DRAFT_684505 [Crucibulum laeve]